MRLSMYNYAHEFIHHHTLHVGELAHPAEPDCPKQVARNPTGSLYGTLGLIDGHVICIHW